MKLNKNDLCPCCSKLDYQSCCYRYIEEHLQNDDLIGLMRSRFTAFVINQLDYLKQTWHPETFPEDLGDDEPNNWVHLEIIDSDIDLDEGDGEVEFRATLIHNNKKEILHERSFFEKVDGHWVYHSGEFLNESQKAEKIKGGDLCPCESGKTYKNCHGK